MKTWQRRTFNALVAAVTVTGALYFWMKYGIVTDDPFAVVNHPLQSLMLAAHLVSSPALLVMFGIVFSAHVASKLARRIPLRRSGLTALATFALMAASGYLLQVVVSETWRLVMVWLHVGSGTVFAVSYGLHLLAGFKLWRRAEAGARLSSA